MMRWLTACLPFVVQMRSRHEPVGQSSSPNISDARREMTPVREQPQQQQRTVASDETVLLALDGSTPGPLGIHVVPNIVDGRSVVRFCFVVLLATRSTSFHSQKL